MSLEIASFIEFLGDFGLTVSTFARDCARDISQSDVQTKVLLSLVGWLFINIVLIRLAWAYFGSDVYTILKNPSKTKTPDDVSNQEKKMKVRFKKD